VTRRGIPSRPLAGAAGRVQQGGANPNPHPNPNPNQELLAEYNKAEVLEDYRCDGCGKKGVAEPKRSAAREEDEEDEEDEEEEAPLLIRKQLWLCEVHRPVHTTPAPSCT
jgi:hypothetical protein